MLHKFKSLQHSLEMCRNSDTVCCISISAFTLVNSFAYRGCRKTNALIQEQNNNKTYNFFKNEICNNFRSRGSGAYIFYPAGPAVDSEFSNRPVVRVIKGPLTAEVHVIQVSSKLSSSYDMSLIFLLMDI